jgi:hypothetical protein
MAGNSAEYDTMINLTPDLRLAVKSNLTPLSGDLFAENLISSSSEEEMRNDVHSKEHRAAEVVKLVQDKVKQNPQHYDTFIRVLWRDHDCYSDILQKLHEEFQNGM